VNDATAVSASEIDLAKRLLFIVNGDEDADKYDQAELGRIRHVVFRIVSAAFTAHTDLTIIIEVLQKGYWRLFTEPLFGALARAIDREKNEEVVVSLLNALMQNPAVQEQMRNPVMASVGLRRVLTRLYVRLPALNRLQVLHDYPKFFQGM
jgi:hypothetical protein